MWICCRYHLWEMMKKNNVVHQTLHNKVLCDVCQCGFLVSMCGGQVPKLWGNDCDLMGDLVWSVVFACIKVLPNKNVNEGCVRIQNFEFFGGVWCYCMWMLQSGKCDAEVAGESPRSWCVKHHSRKFTWERWHASWKWKFAMHRGYDVVGWKDHEEERGGWTWRGGKSVWNGEVVEKGRGK